MKKFFICLICSCGAFAQAEDITPEQKLDEYAQNDNNFEIIVGAALGHSHNDCRLTLDKVYCANALFHLPNNAGAYRPYLFPTYGYVGETFAKLDKGKVTGSAIIGMNLPISQSVSVRMDALFNLGENSKNEFNNVVKTAINGTIRYAGSIENKGNSFELRILLMFRSLLCGFTPYLGVGQKSSKISCHFDHFMFNNKYATVDKNYRITQPSVIFGVEKRWRQTSIFVEGSYAFSVKKNGMYGAAISQGVGIPPAMNDYFFTTKKHGYAVRMGVIYAFKFQNFK